MENQKIIERVFELCDERGWTRTQLANISGILDSTLGNSKTRNTALSVPTIRAYCSAFGISLEEFFHDPTTKKEEISKQEIKLIRDFRLLEPEIKDDITALVKKLKKYKMIEKKSNKI